MRKGLKDGAPGVCEFTKKVGDKSMETTNFKKIFIQFENF